MVTRRTVGIVEPIDILVIAASGSSPLSLEPSSARSALRAYLLARYGGVCHPGHQQHLGFGTSHA
jgi:hypothetical protein